MLLVTLVVAGVICFFTHEALSNRCKHSWEIKDEVPLHYDDCGVRRCYGKSYILCYKNCGDIKFRTVKVL